MSIETDYRLIDNLICERLLQWSKLTTFNNNQNEPYYAEYWVDSEENIMNSVRNWSPSSSIDDCFKLLKILRANDRGALLERFDDVIASNYNLSELTPMQVCTVLLAVEGIEVS